MRKLPDETLSIITDESEAKGCAKKEDVDDAARQGSGEGMLQKLLGLNDIKIACVHCVTPRNLMNSTRSQDQVVSSKLRNKRITKNTLKSLNLPHVFSTSSWLMNNNLAADAIVTTQATERKLLEALCLRM